MRLTDAMMLRDGGTTSITVAEGVLERVSYTVDYSLPWDGRERYVFKGQPFAKGESQRLEMGGEEERTVQEWLTRAVNRKFGDRVVGEFLVGRAKNPGKGKWFYALNFLYILTKERCQPKGA